jgi:hypothetical protein
MKFFPPGDKPVHISLTTGHSALVTKDGVELDKMFFKEAFAQGCNVATGEDPVIEVGKVDADNAAQKQLEIKAAIEAMMDGSEEGDFTSSGEPNLLRLSEKVGYRVTKAEMKAAFDEIA